MELFAVITGKFHYNFIVSKRIAVVGADLDLIDDLRGSDYEVVGYFSMQNKNYEVDFLGNHMSIEKLKSEVKLVVAVDDTKLREYIWTNHSGSNTYLRALVYQNMQQLVMGLWSTRTFI